MMGQAARRNPSLWWRLSWKLSLVIIAVVALLIDWAGRVLELLLTPKGTS